MNVTSPVRFQACSRIKFAGSDKKDPKQILADMLKKAASGDAFKGVDVKINGASLKDSKAAAMAKVTEVLNTMDANQAIDFVVAELEKRVGKEGADAVLNTLKGDPSFLAAKVQEQGQAAENVLNAIAQNYGPRVATVLARPVQAAFMQAQGLLALVAALPMIAPAKLEQLQKAVGPAAEKMAETKQQEADALLAEKAMFEAFGAKGPAILEALRTKLYGEGGGAEDPLAALLKQMLGGMQQPEAGEADDEANKPPKSGDDNN